MKRTALAVCEILKYLIIHWRCETEISKGALLEGQLVISIEALNSKHRPDALHCVTTISSVRSICGGLVLKKFLKGKELANFCNESYCDNFCKKNFNINCIPSTSHICDECFCCVLQILEKPRTFMTDCLVIKHFLHKIIIVHHKLKFTFSVKVNGFLSTEIFG
uniref:Uncharacterized protein n=1 Tax=Cavia porcellus TaxID=10141 RepID=H0WBK1_CAVPO